MLPSSAWEEDCDYYLLKALLPMAKRRIPTPSRTMVFGQGRGKPKNGLGIPAYMSVASIISNALPIIKSHFDAVNMVHLLQIDCVPAANIALYPCLIDYLQVFLHFFSQFDGNSCYCC